MDFSSLMERLAEGDEAALAILYAHFGTPVYSLACRVLGDTTLAQEVTQDTFMKVWRHPQGWDASKGELGSWLLTLTRYTAIDRLRHEIRRTGKNMPLEDPLLEILVTEDAAPELAPQQVDQLHTLLKQLPSEQQQVIELAYFKGLTHSQMADLLGLPIGTVKTRLRLGLQKLKGLLIHQSILDD